MSSSIKEFQILKSFAIDGHVPKAPCIIQVDWNPPMRSWMKCNTDGAAIGCPRIAACRGIFRDSRATILGCFSDHIGIATSLHAELVGAITAIEITYKKGWHKLWLECDSKLVVDAFKNPDLVPWKVRVRWNNCISFTQCMHFIVSHIYRKGNSYADKLANFGFSSHCFSWWDLIPYFIWEDYNRNRFWLPRYRFKYASFLSWVLVWSPMT